MKDEIVDMLAVGRAVGEAVAEATSTPKVVGIFDKKEVDVDAPMSTQSQEVLDTIVDIAKSSGPNKVIALGAFLLHADGTMTRSFSVDTGHWCAALGAADHLKWSMHSKYNGN